MLGARVGPGVADRRRLIEGRDQRREQRHEQVDHDDDDADLRGDAHFIAADAHDGLSLVAPDGPWSARLAKPRIGQNGENVGGHVEQNERGGEDQPASLDHRHVMLGDFVDHQLAEAGIDEHRLDHDHADDEIGEIERDDRNDRRKRIRQRMAHDDARLSSGP